MKVYNEIKNQELDRDSINFDEGYLKLDKIIIAHHDKVVEKSAAEIANGLTAQGKVCNLRSDGKWYVQTMVYDNGGSEECEIFPTEAKAAYDEYEDIQVYVPYTEEELKERRLNRLRTRRETLLDAFDKWEKAVLRGRETDDAAIMAWYSDLLDLEENAFSIVPARIKYYIRGDYDIQ